MLVVKNVLYYPRKSKARTKYVWRYGAKPKPDGVTDDVRQILQRAKRPLTVREILNEIPHLDTNYGMSVITSTLERMAVSGEAVRERIKH